MPEPGEMLDSQHRPGVVVINNAIEGRFPGTAPDEHGRRT
jgi:hypothetical protein